MQKLQHLAAPTTLCAQRKRITIIFLAELLLPHLAAISPGLFNQAAIKQA